MEKATRLVIVVVVGAAFAGLLALKAHEGCCTVPSTRGGPKTAPATTASDQGAGRSAQAHRPRLVDIGAGKCLACKMMAPILEGLERELKGELVVEFIDVWKDPAAAKRHGIRVIPTQVFIGPDGKELFRHEGFFSKRAILAKWKELGYDLAKNKGATNATAH